MARRAGAACLVLACLLAAPGSALAQDGLFGGMTTIFDSSISAISTTVTDASGLKTTTTASTLFPRLTVNAETMIFPAVRLSTGGVFELNRTGATSRTFENTSTLTRTRPFLLLRSTNPVFAPGVGYYRRGTRTSVTGLPTTSLVAEDYVANLAWRPAGLPVSDLQFVRTHTFDGERTAQDTVRNYGSLISRYSVKGVGLHYQGSYLGTNDRLIGLETRQVSNGARIDHSKVLLRKRLHWNATYNITRQDFSARSRDEDGEVAVPVVAFAGLFLLSDTPLTTTLVDTPALNDGNLTAGTGINLGAQAVGAGAQARNIGLDLSVPSEVNRLLVWVDRELPANISSTFTWEVYTSTDNLAWRRESVVSAATFGPFENRFRLEFRGVSARYLKVVTRPLSSALIDAGRYPEIFVTELQAELAQSSGAIGDLGRTTHNLNTDVRFKLLDAGSLYYEGSYWLTDISNGARRDTLSNGVSANHRFNRLFAAFGRAAYEQGTQPDGDRTAAVTSATVTFDPLRTLTSSLLYSGLNERVADKPTDRKSVSLRTNAQLYRGIDVQVGVGTSFTTRDTGERLRDRSLVVSTVIAPRPDLSISLNYTGTSTRRTGTFQGPGQLHSHTGYLTVAYDPTRTLHLVLAEEVVAISGERTRTTHNIAANWAPFPDGALQFTIAYNEAVRPLEFGKDRIFRPGVRWTFSRRSYVDVSYQRIANSFVYQKSNTRVFSVDLKVFL